MLSSAVILANMPWAAEGSNTILKEREVPQSNRRSAAQTGGPPGREGNSGG